MRVHFVILKSRHATAAGLRNEMHNKNVDNKSIITEKRQFISFNNMTLLTVSNYIVLPLWEMKQT